MPTAHARTEIMLTHDGIDMLRGKTVFIAGLGGVGGIAAEMIARAHVGKMILLDHDVVARSNLNRQIVALNTTIGAKKTAVMAARLREINPDLEIVIEDAFLRADGAYALLAPYQPDFLMDCIDSIACKAALVKAAQDRNIPVISAMGAGNRIDASKVKIKRLNQTSGCPLAREFRRAIRGLGGSLSYPVVYTDEKPRQPLPHQPITGAEAGRSRAVNGTISYLPAAIGVMMAGHVIHHFITESGY